MGHFTLNLKKKKENGSLAEISVPRNNITTILGFASPQPAPSQDLQSIEPVYKPTGPEHLAPRKPLLKVNTKLANLITPPSSPTRLSEKYDAGCSDSISMRDRGQSPPQTPSPTSPTSQRRMSLTSLHLFKTRRQRKLEKIREGKQPAICIFENKGVDTPPRSSTDDSSSETSEIIDPSSSTTYKPKCRSRRKKSTPKSAFGSLPSPVGGFQMSY